MQLPIRSPKLWLALLVTILLAGLSLLGQSGVMAQSKPDAPLTPAMTALLQDRQPVFPAKALAATPCVGGFAGTYPCDNVDLLAFMPLAAIGGGSGNDIWGWTDPQGGKEYALMGRSSGTAFVDISDPENPVYLGNLPTHTSNSSWRDIKVYANHAYIVSEAGSHGMQIFDLTQLRNVTNPPLTFAATAHFSGFGSAHNIVINEDTGFAYGVGTSTCSGGLHMVDIQNPTAPTDAGCFSADGYTHDAQCVIYGGPDTTHQGQEVCFNSNEDTLTIVDVTNKAAPVQLSRTGYAGSAYTHQAWLTEDHRYILVSDELDESNFGHNTRTYLWDVTDLDSPSLLGNHTATTPAIDHNLYVKGSYVYQSNYRAGLRILDINDVANGNLTEKAFFDIYPSNDNPNFNGSWSNYPYFDSGVVIISGIEQGLFIVRPQLAPDFTLTADPSSLDICVPDPAVYHIDVGQVEGFSDAVTLSAMGAPAGTTVAFSDNTLAPPFTSALTISSTGAASPGSYHLDITGMTPTITHTTTVQLLLSDAPPTSPVLISPANGATNISTLPTLSWTGAGGSYTVEVASDPGFSNIIITGTVSSSDFTISTDLNTNTLYFWRVLGSNACGTGGYSAVYSFTTAAAAGDCAPGTLPNPLYTEDFESGAAGWTHSGTGDTWSLSTANPHGGSMAYHADNVPSVSDQYLVSPAVLLPTGEAPLTLQFWNAQVMEDNALTACYDGAVLEISSNGGSSWTRLESELLTDPYDGPISANFGNPLAGQNAWCGDPQAYLNSIVDLDAWAGQSVNFRFRLATDSSVGRTGWDIDDVKVQSCQATTVGVALSPDMAAVGTPGTLVTYTLQVTNTGGSADTYTLDTSSNWVTSQSTFLVALAAGETTTITVSVEVPWNALVGENDVATLRATSHNNASVSATTDLTTTATELHAVTLSGLGAKESVIGHPVTYTLQLTNTGNVTESFALDALGASWPTSLSTISVTLPAHTGSEIYAWVMVPLTAGNGLSDTAVIQATAAGAPAVTATLDLTTTAIAYTSYFPMVVKP